MTEVGGVFITQLSLSAGSFSTIFAPSGEEIKITMVYAKSQQFAVPENAKTTVSPAIGTENDGSNGTGGRFGPALGGNQSMGSSSARGIQPVLITDSDGLYVGNKSNDLTLDVIVQGVRIA